MQESTLRTLPDTGFLRLVQILGDKASRKKTITESHPALIPVCASTWWKGVKSGRYPQPVKLSPGVTVWRVEDIRALIGSSQGGAA